MYHTFISKGFTAVIVVMYVTGVMEMLAERRTFISGSTWTCGKKEPRPDVTVPGEMQGGLMQTRQDHWKSMELDEIKVQDELSGVLLMGVIQNIEA